jgi:hypothetical protein
MNALVIGANKQPLLPFAKVPCLVIDDGDFIDALDLPTRRTITHFDIETDHFNPLKDMSYRTAVEFVNVLSAVFPAGDTTLTKGNALHQILTALLDSPKKLSTLISDTKDTQYAYQMIERLLLSPVLERVLNHPTNMSFKGTLIARLNRAELGDFDCFVLGNLLISQYEGQVVIPDFPFYAHKGHSTLIRQNRLSAGINAFDEVPQLRNQLMQIETKIGSRCTPDDAELLALYAGIPRGTNAFNDFIAQRIA